MTKVTRIQFWQCEQRIKANQQQTLVGSLWFSAEGAGLNYKCVYKDDNGKVWALVNKDGYFIDPILEPLSCT